MTRALLVVACFLSASALAQPLSADQQLARDIYRELIEIRTVHPDGDNTAAARAMAKRLLDAGFDPADVRVLEPAPLKGNLVARLRGTGELKPLLLLAHIDVVEARKEDWSEGLDPFKLTERGGYFYGRGTIDDKAMAAAYVASLIRYKRAGLRPKRDIIVALTADEEGGTHNGVQWLLANHRPLIEAEFALSEGAMGRMVGGKPTLLGVQVSEKMYLSFELESTNAGGHSSLPRRDNAIFELAAALDRLSTHEFPAHVSYVLRMLAEKTVESEAGDRAVAMRALAGGNATEAQLRLVAESPSFNAQLRTTCVATRLEGGHADNALPQRAKATVNCRLLPGEKAEFVQAELQRVAGPRVTVTAKNPLFESAATDAQSPVMAAIARVGKGFWPSAELLPVMSAGATDGSRLRNAGIPTYGVTGIFIEHGEDRMHGRDERVAVKSLFDSVEFTYQLMVTLVTGP